MQELVMKIKEKFTLYQTTGASDELIEEAQRQLHRKFADSYKEYLSLFGAISFGSTELTGLNVDSHANVVSVTLKEAQINRSFPKDAIVLENPGIEGVLILQESDGQVYEWKNGKRGATFSNLKEYLESKIGE